MGATINKLVTNYQVTVRDNRRARTNTFHVETLLLKTLLDRVFARLVCLLGDQGKYKWKWMTLFVFLIVLHKKTTQVLNAFFFSSNSDFVLKTSSISLHV